jgi:hypothetical protein
VVRLTQVAPQHVDELWIMGLVSALFRLASDHSNAKNGGGPIIRQDPNVPRLAERYVLLQTNLISGLPSASAPTQQLAGIHIKKRQRRGVISLICPIAQKDQIHQNVDMPHLTQG